MHSEYGLIGYPLGHSFSRAFFNNKFEREGIDAEYLNFEISSADQLLQVIAEHPQLRGLNVTLPHKQAVIPFLDELSPEARAIGAVNVIRISRLDNSAISRLDDCTISPSSELSNRQLSNREIAELSNREIVKSSNREIGVLDNRPILKGFNSDIIGFTRSLQPLLQPHHQRALVLGTGGASRAICVGLQQLGLQWRYVSRNPASPSSPSPSSPSPFPSSPSPSSPSPSSRRVGCPATPLQDPPLPYSALTPDLLAEYTVIVNCTPLGMYPKVDTCPPIPYEALTPRHLLFDLVYNPEETLFLQKGRQQGATVKGGLEMLHLQAIASWEFWNGKD